MPQSGRHAAPRDPARRRAALLPSVLLAATGTAFGGLVLAPTAASGGPRMADDTALTAVHLAAPANANVALLRTLQKGAAAAAATPQVRPAAKPAAKPAARPAAGAGIARPATRASRDRGPAASDGDEADRSTPAVQYARPGVGRLTSSFGRRWGRLHAGIDLASGIGSPIRAVTHATVLSAGMEGGYGRCIRLRHADGTVSVYGHLSSLLVDAGDRVSAGQMIAREGNTGHSTGPHLHFEIRINGTPVNPAAWLRARGVAL